MNEPAIASTAALLAVLLLAPGCTRTERGGERQETRESPPAGFSERVRTNILEEPKSRQEEPALTPEMVEHMRENCPMMLEVDDLQVELTDGGIALTFATESGNLDELRRRVRYLGDMYAAHDGRFDVIQWHHMDEDLHPGQTRAGSGMTGGSMSNPLSSRVGTMPRANVAVIDLREGARLILTPVEESDLGLLRAQVRAHYDRLSRGYCWTMGVRPLAGEGPGLGN